MEISANTVNILKNFASVNSNIIIKPGKKLMTISEAKNILAEATVPAVSYTHLTLPTTPYV